MNFNVCVNPYTIDYKVFNTFYFTTSFTSLEDVIPYCKEMAQRCNTEVTVDFTKNNIYIGGSNWFNPIDY